MAIALMSDTQPVSRNKNYGGLGGGGDQNGSLSRVKYFLLFWPRDHSSSKRERREGVIRSLLHFSSYDRRHAGRVFATFVMEQVGVEGQGGSEDEMGVAWLAI